jgi:hypothetical protein
MAVALSMTFEPVSAFNGLDVLVARDEGLFLAEGLDLRIATRDRSLLGSTAHGTIARPTTMQGRLVDKGEAVMFQG